MSKRDRSGLRFTSAEIMTMPLSVAKNNPCSARKSKARSATHRASPCRTIQRGAMLTLTGVMESKPLFIGEPETNAQTLQMRRNHLMGF